MAQKDSKVDLSLAETSTIIARESKKDSSAIKAIAVLVMCFLPETFLAICTPPPSPCAAVSISCSGRREV
jgi:hypothetical protein